MSKDIEKANRGNINLEYSTTEQSMHIWYNNTRHTMIFHYIHRCIHFGEY